MVRSLVAGGLPRPLPLVGDVVEALGRAGLFRLRGMLIGTAAFQCYAGYLGIRLPSTSVMTSDADFAPSHGIAISVGDTLPPVIETLRAVDPTFEPIAGVHRSAPSTRFKNRRSFEFLIPNTGSDENEARPAVMPSPGGTGAQLLRFLDFLIHEPVRSVMLHKGGVLVTVPAPERYAVHELIVATRRRDDDNGRVKARKDLVQSSLLITALHVERRLGDLGEALLEAWDRGPRWREALAAGRIRLGVTGRALLDDGLAAACKLLRRALLDVTARSPCPPPQCGRKRFSPTGGYRCAVAAFDRRSGTRRVNGPSARPSVREPPTRAPPSPIDGNAVDPSPLRTAGISRPRRTA